MVDPGIHAEMALLIQREQQLERRQTELVGDLELWRKRTDLAEQKGKSGLAAKAHERLEALENERGEIVRELESICMQKSQLRYESRRPSGDEVVRAETMVEMARLSGLLDDDEPPDDPVQSDDEDMVLDFSTE